MLFEIESSLSQQDNSIGQGKHKKQRSTM